MTSQKAAVFFVRALTPVHIGVDIGLGAINLPTMRESITQHPVIPGSSFKGVLRDLSELPDDEKVESKDEGAQRKLAAFGPSRLYASDYRGGLVLSDARLLLLPLPSLKGTFAWTTSRAVLRRFSHDLLDAEMERLPLPEGDDTRVTGKDSRLLLDDGRVSLREVLVEAKGDERVAALASSLAKLLRWGAGDDAFFTARLAVLPDEVFDAFARRALEVRARVAIDSERGTAEKSGPWTEEHIPAESVLAGLVLGRKTTYREPAARQTSAQERRQKSFTADEMLDVFTSKVAQGQSLRLGGHSSIGLGRIFLTCARKP